MIPAKVLEKLEELANQSECVQKMACVLTGKRNKIVGASSNLTKTHPRMLLLGHKVGIKYRIHLHAELAALIKCREKPTKAFVIRILKNGKPGLAKPCKICTYGLELAGISEVIYSTNSGFARMQLEAVS